MSSINEDPYTPANPTRITFWDRPCTCMPAVAHTTNKRHNVIFTGQYRQLKKMNPITLQGSYKSKRVICL